MSKTLKSRTVSRTGIEFMDSRTRERLRHATLKLGVSEEDLGISAEEPTDPSPIGASSVPSEDDVREFVAAVAKMRVGESGILPSWFGSRITPRLNGGRRILMDKSSGERIGEEPWCQKDERWAGTARQTKEKGRLLHKVPTGETGRWTICDDYEIWLLDGSRLFICHFHVYNIGHYDDGTSATGWYNDSWSVHRYGKAVLQREGNLEFRVGAEHLDEIPEFVGGRASE